MNIQNFYQTSLGPAYDILCSNLPRIGLSDGLFPTFCCIPVDGETKLHTHFETEIFYIIEGKGVLSINNENSIVHKGDLVQIPSYAHHQLKNTSERELNFLSIYSEDISTENLPKKVVLTAAPPTPNGPLHLGHISGPYLALDVLQRYLKTQKVEIISHCGTDDNQNYVEEKALHLGIDPEIFRNSMRQKILHGFEKMQITFDQFIEPKTDSAYQMRIEQFLQRAITQGVVKEESLAFPYCSFCEHFLVDALAQANCPHCHKLSRGACENCGLVVLPSELKNIHCTRCKMPAKKVYASALIFNLGQEHKVLVTHPNQPNRIHVWFEMAAHYEQFALSEAFWIHCFGFDNSFYYSLFIPALLKAMNPKTKLPDKIVMNQFLLLDGEKFSTSRGHALWANEVNQDASDSLRLYLCLHRPATTQTNFSLEHFENFSRDLQQELKQLETIPDHSASADDLLHCARFVREMHFYLSLKNFDLRQASRRLLSFMDKVDKKSMLPTLIPFLKIFMPGVTL